MKPAEAAALLTIAAAFDNRKPDADQAKAWAMALDGLRYEDCRDAIVGHYRASREWMMPSDVVGGVKRIRRDRIMAYGPIEPPASLDPDDTGAWFEWEAATTRRIADGDLVNPTPQLHPGPRGPWTEERDNANARIKELRAELALRKAPPTAPPDDETSREEQA